MTYRFILIFTILIFTNFTSKACSCNNSENTFTHLLEANHVFLATVMSASDCGDNNKYEYELYVEVNYKGTLSESQKIYTDCVTSCGFQLEKGKRIIFFTDLENNTVNFCDKKIEFSDTAFIPVKKYLDKIKYTKLDYLELSEGTNKTDFKAKLMVQDGKVNGVVNIYDRQGNITLKGLIQNGKMQGYFEIRTYTETFNEVWSGNYKNGERHGNWVYKSTSKTESRENKYILYIYNNGEITEVTDLDKAAQLEKYKPKKI